MTNDKTVKPTRRGASVLTLVMGFWSLVTACWLLTGAGASTSTAQEPPPAPVGVALENVSYPFPVRFLTVSMEGEPARMAYMDVAPPGGVKPNGRTALLLHGKNFYGNSWAGVARDLAAAGWRVVVPDQVGFGKSAKPDVAYSFDGLAANTARLLDEVGVTGPVAVIGHSTGGMLAVRFARTFPARVSRLVLEDPVGMEDYRVLVNPPPSLETLVQAEMEQTPDKLRAFYGRYFPRPRPDLVEPAVAIAGGVLSSGEYPRWARASARTYLMILREPVRAEYRLLTVPTLLIVGAEDHTAVLKSYAKPEDQPKLGRIADLARTAVSELPEGSRLVVVPGVGHVPHLEEPEQFARALREFLGE